MTSLAIATPEDLSTDGHGLETISEAYQAYLNSPEWHEQAEQTIAKCIAVALLKYAVAPTEHGVKPGTFPEFDNAEKVDVRRIEVTEDGIHFLALANGTLRQGYVHTQDEFKLQIR